MLDNPDHSNGPEKPTWEDIEATLQFHINRYCKLCNNAVRHTTSFTGDSIVVTEIIALAGNKILHDVITNIIAELNDIDPLDISFHQFIKKLRLKLKNYEPR